MSDDALRKALQPFVYAYLKAADPGTSDLDNEQPFHITVPLGACRRASAVHAAAISAPPSDVVGEHIVRAAIQWQGGVWSVPRPGRHGDVFSTMGKLNQQFTTQGFLTSTGRFVNRFEAYDIARSVGQIIRKTGPSDELFSEDLW